jgi:hypothetical protein
LDEAGYATRRVPTRRRDVTCVAVRRIGNDALDVCRQFLEGVALLRQVVVPVVGPLFDSEEALLEMLAMRVIDLRGRQL